ncbi:MAG: diaminopimelate dehydrogenase [Clostridia bacterium]|nr:diaminopimelate dehydrogenase [Clostridia bacterium]
MSNKKINVAICGYGNLGRGVERAIAKNPDMELVGIFTRRDPATVDSVMGASVYNICDLLSEECKEKIDVLILCGGSATDLPEQGPTFAGMYNTVDSFDTHAKIPEYFKVVNQMALGSGKTAIISTGWDPGMFSKNRLEIDAILPGANLYTFWGPGVSQGHSDAIRRINGVKDARQYTMPVEKAMNQVRDGENPVLSVRQKHTRVCYVVAEEGADTAGIEKAITTMPNYFDEYDTTVYFITEEEMREKHSGMPHGGSVIGCGVTGEGNNQVVEYSLKLASNPEFTGSVLVAYARAAYRMNQMGLCGAKTVFDVAPAMLSAKTHEEMIKML